MKLDAKCIRWGIENLERIGANLFLENMPIHLGQEKENKTTVN